MGVFGNAFGNTLGQLSSNPIKWGLVSETDATPFSGDNNAGGGTNVTYRKKHYIHPCDDPKLIYINAGRINAVNPHKGKSEGIDANVLPIPVQASLERAAGTIHQTALEVVQPGIKIFDAFTGVNIPALEECWIRNFVDINSVASYRASFLGLWGGAGFGWPLLNSGEGKSNGNLTAAGVCTPDYAGSATITGVSAVIGRVNQKNGVFIIGDSTTTYSYSVWDALGAWWQKAFHGILPYISMGVGQDLANNIASPTYNTMRMSMAKYCKTAIIMVGINDTNNGFSANQTIADYKTICDTLRAKGIIKVYITTISPTTTSTDGWLTITNQTVYANDPVRQSINSQLRAGELDGYATVIDVASSTEIGTTGKWVTDETVYFGPAVPTSKSGHKFTFNGQSWTPDQFKGMSLYSITSNTSTLITSNTATEIYTSPSGIAATDTVRITKQATIDGIHYSTYGGQLVSEKVKEAYGI